MPYIPSGLLFAIYTAAALSPALFSFIFVISKNKKGTIFWKDTNKQFILTATKSTEELEINIYKTL